MAGVLTRAQILTEVANTLGRLTTATATDQSTTLNDRLENWVEWAKLRLTRAYSFPELDIVSTSYSFAASDVEATFTELFGSGVKVKDVLGIIVIDGTSSRKLTQRNYRRFDQDHPYPAGDAEGKPSVYTLYGQTAYFWQVPDATYTSVCRASKYPAVFTGDSDTLPWDTMDDVIVTATVYEGLTRLNEPELAATWFRDLRQRVIEATRPFINGAEDWEPEGRMHGSTMFPSPSDYWNDPFNQNPTGP